MQNGELARSTQRLIEMLRPESRDRCATAMTWSAAADLVKRRKADPFPGVPPRLGGSALA
jgi:hypothetical protein